MDHDELPASVLCKLASSIAPNLTKILNASISNSYFPSNWKKANIAAVWKNKGSKADVTNYRPISVLPILAKLFEREIAKQLTIYCDKQSVIPLQQFGFRAKSSCEAALINALDGWMEDVDRGDMVGALLIDLSKAFDSVPHQKLLNELAAIGCSSGSLKWFATYLSNRRQRVVSRSITTDWKNVGRGVPQGSCLSPLLFSIFVRDNSANSSNSMQFADDLTNSVSGASLETIGEKLVRSFEQTKSFCDSRDLIINTQKTQLIIFKVPGRKIATDFSILLDGCAIKPASSVKLLGVMLDQHFTFCDHLDSVSSKCRGILGALARASQHLSRDLLRIAYIALVRSHLEYCSAIFASAAQTQLAKLDVIQRMGSRIICGATRSAHSGPLLSMLNLELLGDRRMRRIVSLVESIMAEDCHPALLGMFSPSDNGSITNDKLSRIGIGKRRFSVYAKEVYNLKRSVN
jgi:hypothetical protein